MQISNLFFKPCWSVNLEVCWSVMISLKGGGKGELHLHTCSYGALVRHRFVSAKLLPLQLLFSTSFIDDIMRGQRTVIKVHAIQLVQLNHINNDVLEVF